MPHITIPPQILQNGYRLVSRATFMDGLVEIGAFSGASPGCVPDIEASHAQILSEMQDRAARHPGNYVIYDPSADAEGWMLVGDDPLALLAETDAMLTDLAA